MIPLWGSAYLLHNFLLYLQNLCVPRNSKYLQFRSQWDNFGYLLGCVGNTKKGKWVLIWVLTERASRCTRHGQDPGFTRALRITGEESLINMMSLFRVFPLKLGCLMILAAVTNCSLVKMLSQSHFDAAIGKRKDSRGSLYSGTDSNFLKLPTYMWAWRLINIVSYQWSSIFWYLFITHREMVSGDGVKDCRYRLVFFLCYHKPFTDPPAWTEAVVWSELHPLLVTTQELSVIPFLL